MARQAYKAYAVRLTKPFADAVLKVHGAFDNVPVLGDVNTEEVVRVRDAFMATGAAT